MPIVQVAVSFWAVRYYVRRVSAAPAPRGFIASMGPLEAVNGVLMLGMTGAALMAILQHLARSLRVGFHPQTDD